MRIGGVYINNQLAGKIIETNDGDFIFRYQVEYLSLKSAVAISLTLPLREQEYRSKTLFPFFDGLIPEGWLLDLSIHNWKLRQNDRMGLLLATCQDCIGNVSIKELAS